MPINLFVFLQVDRHEPFFTKENKMNNAPDEYCIRLAKNEIAISLRKMARLWTTLVVSNRSDQEELILAGECCGLLLKADGFGLLSNLMNCLRRAEQNDPKPDPKCFYFAWSGYEFYRIAGYCVLEKELGEMRNSGDQGVIRVLKPGLIDKLAPGLFDSICDEYTDLPDDNPDFSIDHTTVIDLVFNKYSHLCELLAQMILIEEDMPRRENLLASGGHANTKPGKFLEGDELKCVELWLSGAKYSVIDSAFIKENRKRGGEDWVIGDAKLEVKASKTKTSKLLIRDPNSQPSGFRLDIPLNEARKMIALERRQHRIPG